MEILNNFMNIHFLPLNFRWYIDDLSKKDSSKKGSLKSLKEQLQKAAEKEGHALEQKTKNMKARDKKVNCKTFHGAGMVVPLDANEVGYREVPETIGKE